MNPEKIAYPIEEAFMLLGVNRSAGYGLIREGKLQTFKHGRRRQATHAACMRCVASLEAESTAIETGKARRRGAK